jgi:uncharacterized protein (TIGR02147 family)
MVTKSKDISKKYVLSVYGYTDYRKYLRDYYEFRKDSERGYSYRAFSKSAGFTSPNFLKLVMDGERNISTEALEKFVTALHLQEQMAEYFRALVRMNQSKDDGERERWYDQLNKLIPHSKKRMIDSEGHRYLSHWIYPTIRELVLLPDFQEDPYWIARRLQGNVSPATINQAVCFLLDEGFLKRDENNRLMPTDHMVMSSDEVKSLAIRNYHREMMERAKDALENLPLNEREFGALTFVLPQSAMEELKYRLKSFRDELHNWAVQTARGAEADSVIQLNLQMFPHSKRG